MTRRKQQIGGILMNEQSPSAGYITPVQPAGGGLAVRQVLRVWRRHLRLFLACVVVVLLVGVAGLETLKPTYTATANVAIPSQGADPLAPVGQQPVDQLEDDRPATEASMMESRDVAAAVLKQLPPVEQPAGFSLRNTLCHAGLSFLCPKPGPTDPEAKEQAAISSFLTSLTVVPELRSRVIDVSVVAKTGERAAALADAVVSNYQRIALARQTEDVDRVANWLDTRTEQLRQRWIDAVHTADAFSVAHSLTNTGDAASVNPLVNRQIADMATNLGMAQARLAAAQARSDSLQDAKRRGDANAMVAQSEQPILVAAASSLMQLQSTRNQLAAEFGPNYPRIRALDEQIASTRATLNAQTGAALGSIHEELVSAQAEVQQLTDNLDKLRGVASNQSAPQAEYHNLSDEAASARTVYETFLEHQKAVVDRAALLEPPVVFVSHAGIPSRPTFPNKPKLAIGIVVVALVVGAAATFLADYFSMGFEEAEDFRATVRLPLLATLPFVPSGRKRPVRRHVLDNPFSRTSEAVRGLAAQLSLLGGEADKSRSVLVASASAEEGKSTLALWLAMTVRQSGRAVMVVDGDHRRGSLMPKGAATSKAGLTDFLTGRAAMTDIIQTDPETKIDFISAGSVMAGPVGAEEIALLRGLMETLKRSYSLIVLDSPPLLAMTDALVFGSVVDQTVFVCRWHRTSRKAVTASLDRLRLYGAKLAGVVVSMVDPGSTLVLGGEYGRHETKLISRLYGS
jgi:polysaccharide biosynthesis transport protein